MRFSIDFYVLYAVIYAVDTSNTTEGGPHVHLNKGFTGCVSDFREMDSG